MRTGSGKSMSSTVREFERFSRYWSRLRKLFEDTVVANQEFITWGTCSGDSILLPLSVETRVAELTQRKPALFVFGQNCYAKATVINALFGEPVLPVGREQSGGDMRWRMVLLTHGNMSNQVSLSLGTSYEVVEKIQRYTIPDLDIVSEGEQMIHEDDIKDCGESPFVEIHVQNKFLYNNVDVIIFPRWPQNLLRDMLGRRLRSHFPVLVYVIDGEELSSADIEELQEIKRVLPSTPVFFFKLYSELSLDHHDELTESEQHAFYEHLTRPKKCNELDSSLSSSFREQRIVNSSDSAFIRMQLIDLGYLPREPESEPDSKNVFVEGLDNLQHVAVFVRRYLDEELLHCLRILNESHDNCVQSFILNAYDLSREMQITPMRLSFAKKTETQLYASLMVVANEKQDEMSTLIHEIIQAMRTTIVKDAAVYNFQGVHVPESGILNSPKDAVVCMEEIRDLVLRNINVAIAGRMIGSVKCLQDTFVGTLQRCVECLEHDWRGSESGVLASQALKQILNAAYRVELTGQTSSSVLKHLIERMRQICGSLPWSAPPLIEPAWKQKIASDMLNSLSQWKLAKAIRCQFRERLKAAHEAFQKALLQLEWHHSGRLEKTEERGSKLRKVYSPRVARMALESSSFIDMVLNGVPRVGRELGRGQYGIVYACDKWGKHKKCAIKSVVPPDDRHWNDLALEFHYTRSIPEHPRIIRYFGSAVDYGYGCGNTPAFLLVMERLSRDLYAALRSGLTYGERLNVGLDVAQGIRYLHSQGLVHRDIKLKNVLLDNKNQAKITDMGFCKPEAMISGSIVGTPIHMAPELFSGQYDNSVDIYAFGILFWYLCSGSVELPFIFEQCHNKEQLWTNVRKGLRPERLKSFSHDSWRLMQECWSGTPVQRPLPGTVELRIERIMDDCSVLRR